MIKVSWNTGFNEEYHKHFFSKVKHTWDLLPGDCNFFVEKEILSLIDDQRIVNTRLDLTTCPSFLSGIEVKFWRKSRSIVSAIKKSKKHYDYCIWLDADVQVKRIPKIEELIPGEDELLSVNNKKIIKLDETLNKWENPYLKDLGLDTGFVAFNLKHPELDNFLEQYESFWNSEEILQFVRRYDTYVLDRILNKNNFKYLNLWNGNHTSGKKYCGFEDSNLEKYFYHFWGKKQKDNLSKENNNIMKSLVTGGAGFIGSHIVDTLIGLGHQVTVIDNESSAVHEQFYFNEKASYHKLDIADYESTKHLYENIDYVFHCAAESRIQPTILNPLGAVRTNALGTATVLQASREAGVKKVMYSSTSSAYGLANKPPLLETMPDDCLNPYSVSKVAGEKLCSMYTKLFGLKTIIFRYFNVYGPREPVRGVYAPVVGLFLRQKKSGLPLTIVPDGTQRRDFTHVNDVVAANILAMQVDSHDKYGEVFNVGSGTNHSVLELAAMISDDISMIEPRMGEAYITLADNTKLSETFGWTVTKTIEEYVKENL